MLKRTVKRVFSSLFDITISISLAFVFANSLLETGYVYNILSVLAIILAVFGVCIGIECLFAYPKVSIDRNKFNYQGVIKNLSVDVSQLKLIKYHFLTQYVYIFKSDNKRYFIPEYNLDDATESYLKNLMYEAKYNK